MPRTPSQRSGSGSQFGEWWPTHGSSVSGRALVEHQIGEGATGRLVAVTPWPTYPPAQPNPVDLSSAMPADQSRGTRQHAAPAVRDRHVADLGQHRAQHVGQVRDGALGHPPVDVGARGVAVRHAAAADRDAVVDGALCVEEAVRGVADGFAAHASRCSAHSSSGIGSVAIIELFIGSQRRRSPGSRGGEALGRAQHDRRRDGAVRRGRLARLDRGDR